MAIGIDILVGAQQVRDAKKHVEALGSSLQNVHGLGDLGDIGIDPSQSERMREMVSQVNRLNTIAGQGDRRGGILDPRQIAESQRLMQQLTQGVQAYGREMDQLKQKHSSLMREEREILDRVATGRATPEDRIRRREIRRETTEVGDEIDRRGKDEERINRIRQDAMHAGSSIGGMDVQQQNTMAYTIKKALGWGLAAAGGFSILGFLGQSRAKYQQSVGHEGTLYARGIGNEGFGDGVNNGIGPLEQMQMMEHLSASTGMSGALARKAANMSGTFGRYAGVDPSQVAGMYGTMYNATGKEDAGSGVIGMMGEAITKGMNKAKTTELMMMVSRNTQMTAQAMHGAGIDDKQAAQAAAMAIEAIKAGQEGKGYAQFAKSSEMQNFMQNGMQYSGDTLGDMIKARALGDTGAMTWEKRQSIAEAQQGGFNSNPEYLDKIMEQAKLATASEGSTSKAMAGFLGERVFTGLKGAAIQKTVDMYHDKDAAGKNIFQRAKDGKLSEPDQKEMDKWKKEIGDNPANDKLAREARREQLHIEAGEKLNEIIGGLEDAALNMTSSILHTQSAKDLVSAVKEFSDFMKGISEFLKNPADGTKEIMKKGVGWDDDGASEKAVSWLMGWDNKKGTGKQDSGASGDWGTSPSSSTGATSNGNDPWSLSAFVERTKARWGIGRQATVGKKLLTEKTDGTVEVREGNRNWRNHNPGNIEYGAFAKSHGSVGTDGRFAIFPNYEAGRSAKKDLLFGSGSKYKSLTATEAIDRWAPEWVKQKDGTMKHENPNNKNYKASVLRAIGGKNVKLDAMTEEQRNAMMDEMERQEGFKEGKVYATNKDSVPKTVERTQAIAAPKVKEEYKEAAQPLHRQETQETTLVKIYELLDNMSKHMSYAKTQPLAVKS